jgi:SAM-dependent methyltransferase
MDAPVPGRDESRAYSDAAAARKSFTHPLHRDWLDELVPTSARILDYGCGYGRTLAELASLGYAKLVGMDFSPAMVERGRRAHPALDLRVVQALPTAEPAASFDAVLLMAVLTSIPDSDEQAAVMREIHRLLRPGGVLLVSDMPLQTDARSLARYARDAAEFGTYGIFRTEDGAVVRHHPAARFEALLRGFDILHTAEVSLSTMNGHAARAIRMAARRA